MSACARGRLGYQLFARSALYFGACRRTTTFRPVRFVRFGSENNHYLSKDSWGVHMEKGAFYSVRFRALEIIGFSSFKKKCPKVGLAFNTGRDRDPVLSPF